MPRGMIFKTLYYGNPLLTQKGREWYLFSGSSTWGCIEVEEQKPLEGLLKHRLLGPSPRGYFIWETWAWPQLETLQLVRIPRCCCWLQRSLCNPPLASASVTILHYGASSSPPTCLICWGVLKQISAILLFHPCGWFLIQRLNREGSALWEMVEKPL